MQTIFEDDDDDTTEILMEPEPRMVSKLAPREIRDCINSLKSLAEYWY